MNEMEMLLARQALTEAKARYCRFLDTKDWEGFGGLMTEDFELDLTAAGAPDLPIIRGRDNALSTIRASIEHAVTVHQVHSPEMTIDADSARVIWPMNDRVVWAEDKPSLVGYGHYYERWLKQGGEWRLAAQRLVRLHLDWVAPQSN